MGDQRDQRAVAGNDGRRGEGQGRVFHAAIGEGRRQHQDVVAAPLIGTVKLFGGVDHLAHVGEFVGDLVEHGFFGIDPGARVFGLEADIADGQRDQIGRDRLGHRKAEGAVVGIVRHVFAVGRQLAVGAHDGAQRPRHDDAGAIGLADGRAVLGRDPGAGVDLLALAEQEGRRLAGRLGGGQPLQGRAVLGGAVVDDDLLGALRQVDGQRPAHHRVALAQRIFQRPARGVGDAFDVERLGIEDDLLGIGLALDGQGRRAVQGAGLEIGGQVEIDMDDARFLRLGEGMVVSGPGDDGVDAGRRGGGVFLGAGAERQDADSKPAQRQGRRRAHPRLHLIDPPASTLMRDCRTKPM